MHWGFIKPISCVVTTLITTLLTITVTPASAAAVSKGLNITVNYQTTATPPVISPVIAPAIPSNSAFCRITNNPNAFGATYTIVCATGAVVDIEPGRTGMPFSPIHGGAYRYLFQANRGGNLLGTIDSYIGAGTITSWRVVNLTDRDYLEMLVNW